MVQLKSGIYLICNLKTGHKYVGQTVNLQYRIRRHKQMLRDNIHENDYLQKHCNKYGLDGFAFDILEKCDIQYLDNREIFWIAHYETMNRKKGYNLESGGNPQKVVSEETKAKKKGRNNPMFGKNWNEKQRLNITIANRANSKKLTESDVADIKREIANGATQKQIAEKYNLHISTVSKITRGVNWYWVLPELTELLKEYNDRKNEEVVKLFESGVTRKAISRVLEMDCRKINRVLDKHNIQANTEVKHIIIDVAHRNA